MCLYFFLVLSIFFFKGTNSLLDVSSEIDQQDLLQMLQGKVASLTLQNKKLQEKLQVCVQE